MRIVYLMSLVILFWNRIRGEEITLGEIVENNGTWEQNGVVLLLYQIPYDATLFKIRAGFRNSNPMWIQSWTQKGLNGKMMDFTLENQWKCEASIPGLQTVYPPEGQMNITAGQHIGVYFPAGNNMALWFKAVDPKYWLWGSEYLSSGNELIIGDDIKFGLIGYLNRLAIEFYIRSDNPIIPTTTEISTVVSTSLDILSSTKANNVSPETSGNGGEVTDGRVNWTTANRQSTSPDTYGNERSATDGRANTQSSPDIEKYVIISVVSTVGVLVLFAIILGCVIYWRKRRVRREAAQFQQTTNPVYGITVEPDQPKDDNSRNIYSTINSGLFSEIDETAIGKLS